MDFTEAEFLLTISSVHLPSTWWIQFEEQFIVVIITLLIKGF
ncbi:hypothetical protein [Acetivibrio saccincola]|nr:hypothetical protein [Acetivibrio saccincola]HQD28815.1 hypothetical protein [Acetivibrio saccincola]